MPREVRQRIIYLLLVVFPLGVTPETARAQESELPRVIDPTAYVHTAWGTNDGLPQISVNALQQTADGYLWIGTGGGLVRFDGVAFTLFNTANTPALTSNRILALHEGKDSTLWIGTLRGGVVQYRDGVFIHALEGRNVFAFLETSDEVLWIGGSNVLRRVTPEDTATFSLGNDYEFNVYDLLAYSEDVLWIASNRGLFELNVQTRPVEVTPHALAVTDPLYGLHRDGAGNVWVAAPNGFYRWRDGAIDPVAFPFETSEWWDQSRLFPDPSGTIWVGTPHGLFYILPDQLALHHFDHPALNNEAVNAVMTDREGVLWVATNEAGLHRFVPRRIRTLTFDEASVSNNVLPIRDARDGGMWVGTNCTGLLYVWADGKRSDHIDVAQGLDHRCVWSLLEADDGTLWVGTWGGGLFTVRDGRAQRITDERLQHVEVILAMYQGRDESKWIGTFTQGVFRLTPDTLIQYTTVDGLASNDVRYIHEARDGSFWIGTTGGLSHIQSDTIVSYTTADGLGNNFIRAIHEDADDVLWVGTYGGGLSRWQEETWVTITEADGLYDNTISRLFEDDESNLWMSGNKGIARVSRHQLNDFVAGRRERVFSSYYTESAGMQNRETNGGFQPAGWQRRDGTLWFPTQEGIAILNPKRTPINTHPPPAVIETVIADDTTFTNPMPGAFSLDAHQRNLNIIYTGLSFVEPEKVLFRYRLKPFDTDWQQVGTRREAYYTNLPSGAYTFQVVAINNDGVVSTIPATFDFTIAEFWWQHPVMYLLYGLTSIFSIMGLFRWRVYRLRRRQEELEAEVETQVAQIRMQQERLLLLNEQLQEKNGALASTIDQLSEANDQLTRLNDEKNAILSISAHDLRNPIATIQGFTEILSADLNLLSEENKQEMLGYIGKSVEAMKHIVTNLTDLQRLEQGVPVVEMEAFDGAALLREVTATFQVQAEAKLIDLLCEKTALDLPSVYADRHLTERILQNLISNAIKFSNVKTKVTAGMEADGHMVRFWVRDQGPGISEIDQQKLFTRYARLSNRPTNNESTTGLGLSIVKAFAELMQGEVWCASVVGEGSTFYVTLPMVKSYIEQA